MICPQVVAGIFTNDVELIQYTKWSMRIYLAVMLIYGIQVACQYSFWRKIILLIPLIFILPLLWKDSVMGVFLAEPIADTLAICTTAPMFYRYYRTLKE